MFRKKTNGLCLGSFSNNFALDSMEETGLKGSVNVFSIDFNPIGTNDVLDTHRILMKET